MRTCACKFFFLFFSWIIFSMLLRFFATNGMALLSNNHILCYAAISFSFLFANLNNWKECAIKYCLFISPFLLSTFLKIVLQIPLSGEEILDSTCMGSLLFCTSYLFLFTSTYIKNRILNHLFRCILSSIMGVLLIPPLAVLGYYIVSRQLLSTDILLTLFQTNISETADYLNGQNTILWLITGISIIGMILVWIKIFYSMPMHLLLKTKKKIAFYILISLWTIFAAIPKISNFYAFNIFSQGKHSLETYSSYKRQANDRYNSLTTLQSLSIEQSKTGIYVLVIGESETKDHMGVYGYTRNTTPYFTAAKKELGTIVFQHAYSNHTHTVPTLTYALTLKNQYNSLSLNKAYSILEMANIAGYETYWLSNQLRYGAWDTPVAVIAASAKHQTWINNNTGETNDTLYHDAKLIEELPDLSNTENAFLVIHLMGSHGSYFKRYPRDSFTEYKGHNQTDYYDNSVRYTDYFLEQLYNKLSQYKNFQGLIYFSDHGDDVEKELGHEASKFTYTMSRIPLVLRFSKYFIRNNKVTFNNLMKNSNAYWTNDMACDMLIDIIGIQGMTNLNTSFSLASDKYNVPLNKLRTLHGEKEIANDPKLNN